MLTSLNQNKRNLSVTVGNDSGAVPLSDPRMLYPLAASVALPIEHGTSQQRFVFAADFSREFALQQKTAKGSAIFKQKRVSKESLARISLGPYRDRALCAEPLPDSSAAKQVDPTDNPNGNLDCPRLTVTPTMSRIT
jgi:hypothetical protein